MIVSPTLYFYPRSPCGERHNAGPLPTVCKDFYPRSPCGERLSIHFVHLQISIFLSTLSLRRATSLHRLSGSSSSNFYPRSPCGERHSGHPEPGGNLDFYPRSPCGERQYQQFCVYCRQNFYPRSPCGERLVHALILANAMLFLSTLSLRRATHNGRVNLFRFENFYPRSPCGERPRGSVSMPRYRNFYPRSPCGERLLLTLIIGFSGRVFLSTLSLRRATKPNKQKKPTKEISIHALLAESD